MLVLCLNIGDIAIITVKSIQTIMVLTFWDFLIFHQFFILPQVKWSVFIGNKNDIYKMSYKLQSNLRFRILGNWEVLEKSQDFMELQSSG